ncbi:AbrB/MazE/SpoVT family DNA-binding domain-containing protein [Candidatus Woesearchaeota archaeon]|nr:AbrB/MazE/SpoVT family DNA-binding domain-containing protein [Candidatus Woesearchaeota archaeon]
MKKCSECNSEMKEMKAKTPEGVEYKYYKCSNCNSEIVDMKQLHEVANKYREMKRYSAKLTPWGKSLGLRIPKKLAEKYKLKGEVTLIPEDGGIRIVA